MAINTWNTAAVGAGGGADLVIYTSGVAGYSNNASQNTMTQGVTKRDFEDAAAEDWDVTTKVPDGATSISSIVVFYHNRTSSTVLRLRFDTSSIPLDGSATWTQDTTDSEASYSTPTGNDVESITVPSAAYNGITVTEDFQIGLRVNRAGNAGADTYADLWEVLWIEWTFA